MDLTYRQVVYGFFKLKTSEKASIAKSLDLLTAEENTLTELEKYKILLKKAKKKGTLWFVEEAIKKSKVSI